jgi:hypothetical protein
MGLYVGSPRDRASHKGLTLYLQMAYCVVETGATVRPVDCYIRCHEVSFNLKQSSTQNITAVLPGN